MKNFIKGNWFKILFLLTIVLFMVLYFTPHTRVMYEDNETKKAFMETDISTANEITCTYPQILNTNYLGDEITHSLPKAETNPMIFTFSKLDDQKVGQLSFLDSTQTITTVPIVKLVEDNEKIIYLDGTGENYFSTHTIYKKLGVSTFTKSVSLFGIPSGSLAMGSCIGY